MSASDKARNRAGKLAGLAREKRGQLIGDEDQEQEGKAEKAKADLEDAGEKIKDAFRMDLGRTAHARPVRRRGAPAKPCRRTGRNNQRQLRATPLRRKLRGDILSRCAGDRRPAAAHPRGLLALAAPALGLILWFAQDNAHGLVVVYGFVLGPAVALCGRAALSMRGVPVDHRQAG
ncbi:hypothetical protein [Nocardia sp. NBC_01388]|uniref:CsbD family protein n=1 Tax=Nocardia sp. NBC_01388 TaxID=2903596 RepID=UPI0038667DB1